MCDSNANLSSDHRRMHPTLIPDDIASSCSAYRCSKLLSNLRPDSENFILSDDQGLNSTVQTGNNQCNLEGCDIESVCRIPQTPSTSKSSTPNAVSSSLSSSHPHIRSQAMNSAQNLSALQKMIDLEEVNRSALNDHRALKDLDPCFHKQVWRERVAQWCYDVLDYLEESREVAAVAMNIIDRYLAVLSKESSLSTSLVIGEFDYEVISFTALFLAIRVSGSNKELEISELLKLSSSAGAPQVRHIVSAGNSMLQKLSWNHQLLTSNSFLQEFVALLKVQCQKGEASTIKTMTHESISNLVEFASYLVEVSVCDVYFSALAPSKIAFGSLALAMMCNSDLSSTVCQHKEFLSRFFQNVHEQTSVNIESPQMSSILSRLLHVYNQSQEAAEQIIELETIQWEGLDDNGTYQATLPHIILDEAEGSNITNGRICSSNKSEGPDALNDSGLHVDTNTNQTRPVSPMPHCFR